MREKLDLVTLPREAARPAILRFDPSLDPILRLRLSGGDNLQRLRRIADRTVKSDLEGVAGVAAVRVVGRRGGGDPGRGRRRRGSRRSGLTLADVTRRLAEENVNLAGGSLTEGQSEYLVRATNQFLDPERDRPASSWPSRPDGVIRVSDVATVARGAKDREVIARVDGQEAVEISVYKEGDANTVAVARAVKRRVDRLAAARPSSRSSPSPTSRASSRARSARWSDAALVGGLLAVLVLFAFLRDLRSTLIIGAVASRSRCSPPSSSCTASACR